MTPSIPLGQGLAPAGLSLAQIFHVGFIVDDIQRAMEEIGSILSVTWTSQLERPAASGQVASVVYSRGGPLHVELLQATPGAPWTPSDHEGQGVAWPAAHHLGFWSSDPEADAQRIRDAGGSRLPGSAYFEIGGGVLLELVASERQPEFERWFEGGSLGPGGD